MRMSEAVRAFLTVFPAELPDKTMVATVVLTTRYRLPLAVWLGAAGAFTVHVAVAVLAGRLLTLLPALAVQLGVAALFLVGAVVLWRQDDTLEDDEAGATRSPASFHGALVGSFTVVLLAEWGDLTQLATAGLAARSESALSTALGALLALWAVAGLAAVAGRTLERRIPVRLLRRIAAAVFAALAVGTLAELVWG
jgi:putative Ca2+/H+ antiporter (TMEM165/GDT1 family)